MAKQVFRTEAVLIHRLDKSYHQVSFEEVEHLRKEHPEFEKLWWNFSLITYRDNTARMVITVTDQDAPNYRENLTVFFWIAGVSLLLFLLTYL